jgi:hypothetical protein
MMNNVKKNRREIAKHTHRNCVHARVQRVIDSARTITLRAVYCKGCETECYERELDGGYCNACRTDAAMARRDTRREEMLFEQFVGESLFRNSW